MSETAQQALERALERAGAPWEPSAVHGLVTGWLTGGTAPAGRRVAAELLGRPAAVTDAVTEGLGKTLELVIEATHHALRDELLGFTPWLPPDEAPLAERVRALAEWAQGFGMGFALGTRGLGAALPEAAREVLGDLAEISRAAPTQGADGEAEEEEMAFAELYEYLRMAVLMLHEEMRALREVPPP